MELTSTASNIPNEEGSIPSLTNFCVNNLQLQELEGILAEFNVFEAAGLTRDEFKHSRFLSFLMNPRESHGLGDAFLKRFLQMSIQIEEQSEMPVTPLELELWDLTDTEIRTEWGNIDLIALNYTNHLAVVVENKIGTGEHSDQLNRYYSEVNHHYPGWRVLPILLSPEGRAASNERYFSLTYELVADILRQISLSRKGSLSPDILTVLEHYEQLIRRHVVSNSKVQELCKEIYRKHRKALDLIYQYRDDEFSVVRDHAQQLIESDSRFADEQMKGATIAFIPQSWREWMPVWPEKWWAVEGWMLLFWFEFGSKGVRLILDRGPGDLQTAQRILDAARAHKPLFDPQSKIVNKHWNRLYRKELVTTASLSSGDMERIISEFDSGWSRFLENDLEKMAVVLREAVLKEN